MKIFSYIALVALSANIFAADNFNNCINESTGLGGYQFENRCTQDINLFFRTPMSGGLPSSNWKRMSLHSRETKVVNSYSSPYIACPIENNGKPVSLDPNKRKCVVVE